MRVSGTLMADDVTPDGHIVMARWKRYLAEADAMVQALSRAGYELARW